MVSMMYPPSLSQAILMRSFLADNGELGLLLEDVPAFLDACQTDHVKVLGWELWLADHSWHEALATPAPVTGFWCGLIPLKGETAPGVFQGSGDLETTRGELAALKIVEQIDPKWLGYVRVNVTLD